MSIALQRTSLTPSGFIGSRPRTGFLISGGGPSDPADLSGSGYVISGGIPFVDVAPGPTTLWVALDVLEQDGSWVKSTGDTVLIRPSPTPASAEWGIRDGQIVRKVGSQWRKIGAIVEGDTIMFSASEPGAYPPNNRHSSANYRVANGRPEFRVVDNIWAYLTCQNVDDVFVFDWTV